MPPPPSVGSLKSGAFFPSSTIIVDVPCRLSSEAVICRTRGRGQASTAFLFVGRRGPPLDRHPGQASVSERDPGPMVVPGAWPSHRSLYLFWGSHAGKVRAGQLAESNQWIQRL